MTDLQYVVKIDFGSVRLGAPTGRWVQDPDGWWREVYTDTVWLDRHGVEERRAPFEAMVRMSMPPWEMMADARRGWLSRLFKPGKRK